MKRKQYHGIPGTKSLNTVRKFFPHVEKLIDADKPVIVEVTNADVTKSEIKSHATCALAVACTRTFAADGVIIGLTVSYIVRGKTAIRYHLAGTVSREITSFDRKAGFDVGFYLLSPFAPSAQLGRYRPQPPHPKRKAGDRRKFRHFTGRVRTFLNQV